MEPAMQIKAGFEVELFCAQPTFCLLMMEIHPEEAGQLASEHEIAGGQPMLDRYGNRVTRLTLPAGASLLRYDVTVARSPQPEPELPDLTEVPLADLPADVLPWLTASRYCDSDLLASFAWAKFGALPPGSARVRGIFDFVHQHIYFGYHNADATRTASGALAEGRGVCRDFAHLAIALCRAMNIPARYCNGYLGDIGVPPNPAPMDFNAWAEVWLEGNWYTLDARHNEPRIGRILIARGRDAADIPMINTFGPHDLRRFTVWTEAVDAR